VYAEVLIFCKIPE